MDPVTCDLELAMVADPDLVPAIVIQDVAYEDEDEDAALSDNGDLDAGTLNPQYKTFLH